MDVHQEVIVTAGAEAGRKGEVRETGAINNDQSGLDGCAKPMAKS